MSWYWIGAIVVVLVVMSLIKRVGLIGVESARSLLSQGAKLVDVRTESEFRSGHLHGAINLPVSLLRANARRVLPDSNAAVLLHCHSGSRSQVARRVLRQMGYTQVHNLGSYGRAERIVQRT